MSPNKIQATLVMHFCARTRSGFFPSTYAHRDWLSVTAEGRHYMDSQSVSVCVSGGEKSRACLGIEMHHWTTRPLRTTHFQRTLDIRSKIIIINAKTVY